MKAYVMTTGSIFGLVVAAHVWRAVAEGPHLAADPVFILTTAIAAALGVWAWRLLRLSPRQ
jgi:hypothetical protein